MFRRLVPLAVAIVILVGCKKKATDTADGGDPNATYTLKVREEQQGDKLEVAMTPTGMTEITPPPNKPGTPTKLQQESTAEYTGRFWR